MVRPFILPGPTHLCLHIISLTVMMKLGKNLYFKQCIIATSSTGSTSKTCTAKPTPVHRHHHMLFCSGIAQCHQERRSKNPPFVQSCILLAVLLALICDTASCCTVGCPYRIKLFPLDNSKLAKMVFYLVADLECDLTVFHPIAPQEVSFWGGWEQIMARATVE